MVRTSNEALALSNSRPGGETPPDLPLRRPGARPSQGGLGVLARTSSAAAEHSLRGASERPHLGSTLPFYYAAFSFTYGQWRSYRQWPYVFSETDVRRKTPFPLRTTWSRAIP